ncbi:transmembrane 7 superfamily member 3-like [Epargyreus clarus]|uniref:transmembrane 7 superfamily member 3-like n=1 Tax=Epargyreus clarus TaxID=520877 RepID=UPI003C309ADC
MFSAKVFSQTKFIFLLLPILFGACECQNASLTIPLNKTISWADKELYGGFVTLNATSTLQVNLVNENKDVSYIIFQVHSHLYNVTLYNNSVSHGSTVVGTNIGLYSAVKPAPDVFYIYNQNTLNLKLYISIHGYDSKDPIPGGCNMEFPTSISPYLRTTVNKDFILIDAAAAKDSTDKKCTLFDGATVVFYKMFILDGYFDTDTYFKGLKSMLTLGSIVEYGEFVPENGEHMRRRLAAYPATGAVYVAIAYSASNKSAYSVYVPDTTYGCDPLEGGDCDILDDTVSRLLCAALFFVGLFVCYLGHHFFKTEMFLVGLMSGVLVTYIAISLIAVIDRPPLLGASMLSGVCFGAIWLLFWWFYGIPIFAVLLSTLNVGFLFAAIIYHGLPGGLIALQVDFNFWTLFILITILTSLMLVSMTFLSNILCCVILGSYAAVFSVDYSVGSYLKYIIINTVRRAVVPKFNKAILSPPFGWRDVLVSLLWVTLALTGFLVQHYHNRGRPPFPPPPRSVRPTMPGLTYGTIGSRTPRRGDGPTSPQNRTANNETAPLLA